MPLDEWQDVALEAAMGERANGKWASKYVGISAPRQNGKSQLIVARVLAGLLLFDEKMIIVSAHETDTAREIWKRLIDVVESNPTLEARVTGRMDAINREYLSIGVGLDRQTVKLKARRKSGVRGFSADCLLLDEAQILGKAAWGSINPTMSARPNPQMWLMGTPPTEDDDPFAFSRVRESSIAKKARHTWLEWSAGPGDDFDDPETWAKANPSFGVRISQEACEDDRAAMDDEQFAMERLGMWADDVVSDVFDGHWPRCKVDPSASDAPLEWLGIAVSVDLKSAGIVGGGRVDGVPLVKPLAHGRGMEWIVAEFERWPDVPVVIDGRGPGAVLLPALRTVLGRRLHEATTENVKDACAEIWQRVTADGLMHPGVKPLDDAVSVAVQRPVGDRWAWGRRKSTGDICLLEAATLVAWALETLTATYEVLDSIC